MLTKEDMHLKFRKPSVGVKICWKCKNILEPPRVRYCKVCAKKVNPYLGTDSFKPVDKPCKRCKTIVNMTHNLQLYCKPCAKKAQSESSKLLGRKRSKAGHMRANRLMDEIQDSDKISDAMFNASKEIKNYLINNEIHNPSFSREMLSNMVKHHKIGPYIIKRFTQLKQDEDGTFINGYSRCKNCKSLNCMTLKVKEKIDKNLCMNCGTYYREDYTTNKLLTTILMHPFRLDKHGGVQE